VDILLNISEKLMSLR